MKLAMLTSLALAHVIAAGDPIQLDLAARSLRFELDGVEDARAEQTADNGQIQGLWTASLGGSRLTVSFATYDREALGMSLPEDVVTVAEQHYAGLEREQRADGPEFRFQEQRAASGSYGYVPYAWLGVHTRLDGTRPAAQRFCLGGVLADAAWSADVLAEPALGPEDRARLEEALLASVTYSGDVQDPQWTDEELEARWRRDAPPDAHDDLVPLRTEHYLILSNCGRGSMKKFGAKMEECYAAIREVYPFDQVEGERLLPVFLFRTSQQYYDFCVRTIAWTEDQARASKGVAWKDFYATWYEAPNDPVHVHEATHQIFANRLRLSGGGSWLQEGVAEYMSTSKNDRKLFKRLVKDEKTVPLAEFVVIPSLLQSADGDRKDGGSEAGEGYLQAACLIEFLMTSDWSKDRFQDALRALGRVPRADLPAIEAALGEVLGTDLTGLEKRFLEYWGRRR